MPPIIIFAITPTFIDADAMPPPIAAIIYACSAAMIVMFSLLFSHTFIITMPPFSSPPC